MGSLSCGCWFPPVPQGGCPGCWDPATLALGLLTRSIEMGEASRWGKSRERSLGQAGSGPGFSNSVDLWLSVASPSSPLPTNPQHAPRVPAPVPHPSHQPPQSPGEGCWSRRLSGCDGGSSFGTERLFKPANVLGKEGALHSCGFWRFFFCQGLFAHASGLVGWSLRRWIRGGVGWLCPGVGTGFAAKCEAGLGRKQTWAMLSFLKG